MAINVEVVKNTNESSSNVIRRFQKRVQGSGVITKIKKARYYTRIKSRNVQKFARLKKLDKKDEFEKLLKLGKVQDNRRTRR
jgi:ribosomal protein S21